MKKLLPAFIGLFISLTLWAQVPQGFNYQAILRDNEGEALPNEVVDINISILQGSPGGAAIYSEVHNTQTNAFGLIILQIGQGTSSQEFSSIHWAEGPFFIQVSVNGTLFGTTQLLSVPYALYAEQAGNMFSGSFNDLTDVPEFPDLSSAFSGNFNDLTNIPENLDTDSTDDFSGSFKDLTDVPLVFDSANSFTGSFNDLTNIPENLDTDSTDDFSGDYNDLINKPEIPEAVAQAFSENDSVAFISDKKVGIGTEAARGRMEILDGGVVFAGDSGTVEIAGAGTRLMWIPEKAAFRAGRINAVQWDIDSIGTASVAIGINTKAIGDVSIAMGSNTQASGTSSITMGFNTKANGENSVAMGSNTRAIGFSSTAMGINTQASGISSIAMGSNTQASGNNSTATGISTQASGISSIAMGSNTQASGNNSTAMGSNTRAIESSSTAMGSNTQAIGFSSTAMGSNTQASGNNSTAMGSNTRAIGFSSTATGTNTQASGTSSITMGFNTKANGENSVAMGTNTATRGNYSTAIGMSAKANHIGAVVISANSSTSIIDSIASSINEQMVLRADGNFFFTNKKINVPIFPPALINTSTGAFLSIGGTWTNASDRNLKENFTLTNAGRLLENIKELEVTTWNYKAEDKNIIHIGPMAQDFYRIYGLGADEKSISTVDGIGVALATIKALVERNEMLESRLEALKNLVEQLLSATQVDEDTVEKE